MAMNYGKMKREKSRSPSSSGAIKDAIAAHPHADVIPPPDPMIAETARRAGVSNEARRLFYTGLVAHEILERYPSEQHWMAEKIGDWEVVHRREQMQVVEGLDKPVPKFSTPKPKPQPSTGEYLPLPPIAVDKPRLKSVGVNVTVIDESTGECKEEMVWLPRKMIKGDQVSAWIVGERRKELEKEYGKKGWKKIELQGMPG